jgi:hypothetical protein
MAESVTERYESAQLSRTSWPVEIVLSDATQWVPVVAPMPLDRIRKGESRFSYERGDIVSDFLLRPSCRPGQSANRRAYWRRLLRVKNRLRKGFLVFDCVNIDGGWDQVHEFQNTRFSSRKNLNRRAFLWRGSRDCCRQLEADSVLRLKYPRSRECHIAICAKSFRPPASRENEARASSLKSKSEPSSARTITLAKNT